MTVSTDKPTYMKHMPHFLGPVAPITIDHAEGSWVYDTDGGKWLDFVVGIAVVNTGHCHPRVVKAVQEQAARLAHAQMNIYRHGPMLELAEKLSEIVPEHHDEFMFANSGAEAVENADQARQAGHAPPGHHRLPRRVPRAYPPHHGAHRLGRALPRPSRAARGQHLPRKVLLSVSHAGQRGSHGLRHRGRPSCAALRDLRRRRGRHHRRAHPGRGRLHRADQGVHAGAARHRRRDRRLASSWTRSRPASAAPARGSATSSTT